jgi:hypothetical protein
MHFEPPADDDDVCQLVGRFRRKAHEQGWTEKEIVSATRGITVAGAVEQLTPLIEPAEPEPLTWLAKFDWTLDYVDGARMLDHDEALTFRPRRFLTRVYRLAVRGSTR